MSKTFVGIIRNKYLSCFYEGAGFHKHARIEDQKTGKFYIGTVREHLNNFNIGDKVKVTCGQIKVGRYENLEYFRRVTGVELLEAGE